MATALRDWEQIGHGIMEGIDAARALIIPYHKPLAAMVGMGKTKQQEKQSSSNSSITIKWHNHKPRFQRTNHSKQTNRHKQQQIIPRVLIMRYYYAARICLCSAAASKRLFLHLFRCKTERRGTALRTTLELCASGQGVLGMRGDRRGGFAMMHK